MGEDREEGERRLKPGHAHRHSRVDPRHPIRRVARIRAPALILATLFAALPGPAAAQDISGTWKAAVELDAGSGQPTFVFKQKGAQITGTYTGTFGGADLSGTVTGDTIEFSFDVPMAGLATYTGTISGDTMAGTCDYGPLGGGTWEAERVE